MKKTTKALIHDFHNNEENANSTIETSYEVRDWLNPYNKEPIKAFFVKAIVIPNAEFPDRFYTGHAYELETGHINSKNALENGETSAIGRALASSGLLGSEDFKIATEDEINHSKAMSIPRATTTELEFMQGVVRSMVSLEVIEVEEMQRIFANCGDMNLKECYKVVLDMAKRKSQKSKQDSIKEEKAKAKTKTKTKEEGGNSDNRKK